MIHHKKTEKKEDQDSSVVEDASQDDSVAEDVSQDESEVKSWEERKKEAKKEKAEKVIPTDCRLCAHYPLQDKVATTGVSPELTAVTKGFTRTFCGQAPANGLNCRDKKFTPIKK